MALGPMERYQTRILIFFVLVSFAYIYTLQYPPRFILPQQPEDLCLILQMNAPTPSNQTDKERGFNGPAARFEIAKSSDYVAHPFFSKYVKWRTVANGHSTLLSTTNLEPDGSPSPADIVIVGVVSEDRPNIGELGNWKDSFNMKLYDCKQQFTVIRPNGFVDFEEDFDVAIRHIKELQDKVAVKGTKQLWFVLDDDSLRFSHRLFEAKPEIPDESSDMVDHELELIKEAQLAAKERALISTQYSVKADMQDSVNELLLDYDLIPLEAYDRSKMAIPAKDLARTLKGALVRVIFNFRYSFISTQRASNFRGDVVQINILKNTTRVSFSPRKKGPMKLRSAVVREDQTEAVRQFLLPKVLPREGSVTADEDMGSKKRKAARTEEESPPARQRLAPVKGSAVGASSSK